MFEAHTINAQHKDLIHDVAYNYYGNRMATCSSDQFVKVIPYTFTLFLQSNVLIPLICQ